MVANVNQYPQFRLPKFIPNLALYSHFQRLTNAEVMERVAEWALDMQDEDNRDDSDEPASLDDVATATQVTNADLGIPDDATDGQIEAAYAAYYSAHPELAADVPQPLSVEQQRELIAKYMPGYAWLLDRQPDDFVYMICYCFYPSLAANLNTDAELTLVHTGVALTMQRGDWDCEEVYVPVTAEQDNDYDLRMALVNDALSRIGIWPDAEPGVDHLIDESRTAAEAIAYLEGLFGVPEIKEINVTRMLPKYFP